VLQHIENLGIRDRIEQLTSLEGVQYRLQPLNWAATTWHHIQISYRPGQQRGCDSRLGEPATDSVFKNATYASALSLGCAKATFLLITRSMQNPKAADLLRRMFIK
jgi:hypothetical protein